MLPTTVSSQTHLQVKNVKDMPKKFVDHWITMTPVQVSWKEKNVSVVVVTVTAMVVGVCVTVTVIPQCRYQRLIWPIAAVAVVAVVSRCRILIRPCVIVVAVAAVVVVMDICKKILIGWFCDHFIFTCGDVKTVYTLTGCNKNREVSRYFGCHCTI